MFPLLHTLPPHYQGPIYITKVPFTWYMMYGYKKKKNVRHTKRKHSHTHTHTHTHTYVCFYSDPK